MYGIFLSLGEVGMYIPLLYDCVLVAHVFQVLETVWVLWQANRALPQSEDSSMVQLPPLGKLAHL